MVIYAQKAHKYEVIMGLGFGVPTGMVNFNYSS